jgi:hypothetical protein
MTNNKIKEAQKQLNKKSLEVSGGTLYDINKSLVEQDGALDEDTVNHLFALDGIVNEYFETHYNPLPQPPFNCYYMLLCHEKRNYTLFNKFYYNNETVDWGKMLEELKTSLNNRGTLYSIEPTEDRVALEIWLKDFDGDMDCYYLFPYNEGVIEVF